VNGSGVSSFTSAPPTLVTDGNGQFCNSNNKWCQEKNFTQLNIVPSDGTFEALWTSDLYRSRS